MYNDFIWLQITTLHGINSAIIMINLYSNKMVPVRIRIFVVLLILSSEERDALKGRRKERCL